MTDPFSNAKRIVRFHRSEGAVFSNPWEWDDLTLATQGSVDKLFYLTTITERFDGPLSVSIFCPGYDGAFADDAIHLLRKCYPKVTSFIALANLSITKSDQRKRDVSPGLSCRAASRPSLHDRMARARMWRVHSRTQSFHINRKWRSGILIFWSCFSLILWY